MFTLNLADAHAEHEEIINAIADRNGEEAHKAMMRHISATERRLEAIL